MDFMNYWQISDIVTKSLFFLLLALSILSWVTGIVRVIQSRKLATTVADDLTQQIAAKRSELADADAATRRLVTEQALLKHIGRYRYISERGLPILGTTAAIAPFMGLFGTVWGIFHALHNIGTSGQAGLGQVAGPIGEALIMTGLGIAVAIPAVVFYNLAVRVNRRIMYYANDKAHDLLAESVTLNAVASLSIKQASIEQVLIEPARTETVRNEAILKPASAQMSKSDSHYPNASSSHL